MENPSFTTVGRDSDQAVTPSVKLSSWFAPSGSLVAFDSFFATSGSSINLSASKTLVVPGERQGEATGVERTGLLGELTTTSGKLVGVAACVVSSGGNASEIIVADAV
jgi:hypothetical protein